MYFMCLMIFENYLLWCIKLVNLKSDRLKKRNCIVNKIDNKFGRNWVLILGKLFVCNSYKKCLLWRYVYCMLLIVNWEYNICVVRNG